MVQIIASDAPWPRRNDFATRVALTFLRIKTPLRQARCVHQPMDPTNSRLSELYFNTRLNLRLLHRSFSRGKPTQLSLSRRYLLRNWVLNDFLLKNNNILAPEEHKFIHELERLTGSCIGLLSSTSAASNSWHSWRISTQHQYITKIPESSPQSRSRVDWIRNELIQKQTHVNLLGWGPTIANLGFSRGRCTGLE